jgi:hypothetical protein
MTVGWDEVPPFSVQTFEPTTIAERGCHRWDFVPAYGPPLPACGERVGVSGRLQRNAEIPKVVLRPSLRRAGRIPQ